MKHKSVIIILFLMITVCSAYAASAEGEEFLVKLKTGAVPQTIMDSLKAVHAEKGIYVTENLKAIEEYVAYASPNGEITLIDGEKTDWEVTVSPFALSEDDLYKEQWQLQMVHADASWELETYGNDIKVAVIDSGCYEHDDLKNNLLSGKNYLTGTSDTGDNHGHGTHVSGIIAAEMNSFGIAGVAPKAKVVPLKCFDPGHSTKVNDILQAIYDAVEVFGCRVINMSWGVKSDDPFLKEAIDYAYSKGAILVAAVGNYGNQTLYYPAAYENVIGVGSVGLDKSKSSFSQFNTSVSVVAPGEKVKSTDATGEYQFMQGTSQATPVVSGIAAVALSVKENLTAKEFALLLTQTAEDLGESGYDTSFGYGLVNEKSLIESLTENSSCYISPINVREEDSYVLIKNNTNENLQCISMFAYYANGQFVDLSKETFVLLPGKAIMCKTDNNSYEMSHLLWWDEETIQPLGAKRVKEN